MMKRMGIGRGRMIAVAAAGLLASLGWQQAGLAATEAATVPVAAPAPDVSKMSNAEIDTLIYERQQVMIQLDKDAELLGEIAAGIAPASQLVETTRSLAKGAKESHAAFLMKVPGGRTKPEAWANWDDYSKRLDAFVASTDKLAKLAETGTVASVTDVLGDALPCKACHDLYREPKKPAA